MKTLVLFVSLIAFSSFARAEPKHAIEVFEPLVGKWSLFVGDKKLSTKMRYEKASKRVWSSRKLETNSLFSRAESAL